MTHPQDLPLSTPPDDGDPRFDGRDKPAARRRHHSCTTCGWEALYRTEVRLVFHSCLPPKRRRPVAMPSILEGDRDITADHHAWFLSRWPKPAPPKENKK